MKAFGGWVEDKNISLVYHYGDVPEHLKQKAIDAVTKSVLEYGYRPVPSHSAIEIKPPVVWSKGHAALLILDETYGIGWEKAVRVFYLGDDTSDEDVMRVSNYLKPVQILKIKKNNEFKSIFSDATG